MIIFPPYLKKGMFIAVQNRMSSEKKKIPLWVVKLFAAIAFAAISGAGYLIINRMNVGSEAATLGTFVDGLFPFNRHWVWFYYLYFVAIMLPFFVVKDRHGLWKAISAYSIVCVVTLGFYALWPTIIHRPTVIGTDLSAKLLKAIYDGDKPYNCFPSQHVAYSWTAAFIALNENTRTGVAALVIAILISLSTLFIKQHWFVDVPSGIAVAALGYFLSYKIIFNRKK